MATRSPVIVALDYSRMDDALAFVDRIDAGQCRLKVGKELFTAAGPDVVRQMVNRGFEVFLDLKFHDIPNTVNKAIKAAADLGVWMVNVHASGGSRMLEAARMALPEKDAPLLIAVTVLTSMEASELPQLGITRTLQQHIDALASLAFEAGLDGVVCSALETGWLSEKFGRQFCLVTPGIRPEGADHGDQRRVVTPQQAVKSGSHYLVVGRPITHADDPAAMLRQINASLGI